MKIIDWLFKQDVQINQDLHGLPHESLSSRTWRLRMYQPYKILRPIVDGLFFCTGPGHCERSYTNEKNADPTYDMKP